MGGKLHQCNFFMPFGGKGWLFSFPRCDPPATVATFPDPQNMVRTLTGVDDTEVSAAAFPANESAVLFLWPVGR